MNENVLGLGIGCFILGILFLTKADFIASLSWQDSSPVTQIGIRRGNYIF